MEAVSVPAPGWFGGSDESVRHERVRVFAMGGLESDREYVEFENFLKMFEREGSANWWVFV